MRWSVVAATLGRLISFFALPMAVPGLLALAVEPAGVALGPVAAPTNAVVFLGSALGALVLGLFLRWAGSSVDLQEKEAYVLVATAWLSLSAVAAVPLLLSGLFQSPLDAIFETMSGLTTTGYTMVPIPLEEVAPSLHLWRALLQWMGGMGVVVLTVAILQEVAISGARLMRAEVPGDRVERLTPRIQSTARVLWTVYAALSLAGIGVLFAIFLVDLGLPPASALFEAVFHALTAIATGGFSTRSASIEAFGSAWLEWAIIGLIFVGGANFTLHYYWLRGRLDPVRRDDEFRFYASALTIGSLAVFAILLTAPATAELWEGLGGKAPSAALRAATFQVLSAAANAGFTSADYTRWPEAARFLLFFAMFMGGSIGSTGGSIKVGRVLTLFKMMVGELRRIAHPRAVIPVKLSGVLVDKRTLRRVGAFVALYMAFFVAGTLLLLLVMDLELFEAASWAAGSLGNVGASFGGLSPAFDYTAAPTTAKAGMFLLMWLGRLELFAVLVLLSPTTYE